MNIHVVKAGDTLFSVAAEYGVSPAMLASQNGLDGGDRLVVGQTLVVRYPALVHTVAPGDTVWSVAAQYGVSTRTLYQNNYSLGGRSALRGGELLAISFEDEEKLGAIGVNGYAYPYIDRDLLDAALPYLSYVTPFTYGIGEDGRLLPLGAGPILSAAGRHRTAALMHLSTLTEAGNFSNARSSLLLGSVELQETLLADVAETIEREGYYGLDIDFEFVYSGERTLYADFVRRAREKLNRTGHPVLVALAPKTRADQPGLLYEAHDYALLGEAANAVLLMAYEWGYTYGPPMAVAPIDRVRAVLDYAVSAVPREKIFLGVPLYGYDWPLPYRQGQTRAESISPRYAVELAGRVGAEIAFDERAMAPYFRYTDRAGMEHEVWFEDARSIDAKLRLVREYGLQGVGYWNLMRDMPQNWTLLHGLYEIETLL